MNIDRPTETLISELRSLWKESFGDTDEFLDLFFSVAYSPDRCRCITDEDRALAAAYWFDCTCDGQRFAYLYAVATSPQYRNRGLCRTLLEDIRLQLTAAGYDGLLLVPQSESLEQMYRHMGYLPCTTVREFTAGPVAAPLSFRKISPEEYARLRREKLPRGGVIQEGAALSLLAAQSEFYAGDAFLAAVSRENDLLHCHEFLGDSSLASALLGVLGACKGTFRTPGYEKSFALYFPLHPLCVRPGYFGLALD